MTKLSKLLFISLLLFTLFVTIGYTIDPATIATVDDFKKLISTVPEVANMLKTTHSTTMSDIKHADGDFKKLDNVLTYKSGTTAHLDKLFDLWKTRKLINFSNPQMNELVDLAFEELLANIIQPNKSSIQHVYNVLYTNAHGNLDMCNLNIRKNPNITDRVAYDYALYVLNIDFIPASPYVVLTIEDSDLLSSTKEQRIQYLDPNINSNHFNGLIQFNTMILDAFSS